MGKAEHKKVKCLNCGAEIIQRNNRQVCCNRQCRNEYIKKVYRKAHGDKFCEVCGKELFGQKLRYCSVECKEAGKLTPEKIKENFIRKFNEKYAGQFEYVSGYEHSDGAIQCRCLQCGDLLTRSAQCVRRGASRDGANIRCSKCASIEAAKRAAAAKAEREAIKEQKRIDEKAQQEARLWSTCIECGNRFKGSRIGLKYCSDKCKRRHNNRYKEISRRKKIMENGEVDYSISLQQLAKRDKYICHICGERVDMKADTNADMYGSIDHVIPVSKGGTHTWDNVKLAHRACNTIKGAKSPYETDRGQMSLCI